LKFLLDVNVGSTIANALVADGHDVIRAANSLGRATDAELIDRAAAEERILITCDRDFSELVFRMQRARPPAILYIRFEPEDIAEVVPRVLAALALPDLIGSMVVVGKTRTRRAAFPNADL
jgi:predicted nuclease of predicted toxin-antitoxin system